MNSSADRGFVTGDGVRIAYLDRGTGTPIVLVPGLAQPSAQFSRQLEDFTATHRVLAVDLRGHGDSDKPTYGYRIARLAADLHELLEALDLRDVILLGHSMGCSVIWSLWDQFGPGRIAALILVDQPALLVADPRWSAGTATTLGTIATPDQVFDFAARVRAGPLRELPPDAYSATMSTADRATFARRAALLPPEHHATLLIDHFSNDWRDVLRRIDVPTLVVAGANSLAGAGACWVAAQIPGARLEVFEADEGGGHFMFWENPTRFNRLVLEFVRDLRPYVA